MQTQFKVHTRFFRPRSGRRIFLWFVIGLLLIGLFFLTRALIRYQLTPNVLWQVLWGETSLLTQANQQTNIVLLGIGGQNHEGGDLTDTMMVASIGLNKHDVVLVTLPRDIWIPTLKDKINAAYSLGEEKTPGGGMLLAKAAVEEVVVLPIHFGVLIDFAGFQKMIDAVGGIDVLVGVTFTDPLYPIAGRETDECGGDPLFACRFETVTFTKGAEHMGGERALKYVRSRHAEGDSGTDFARGTRQQAVLIGLKNKLMQKDIFTNIGILRNFLASLQETIVTDMPLNQTLLLSRLFLGVTPEIRTAALTQDEPEKKKVGLLVNPPLWQYSGAWVLTPKHDGFSQIGKYISCVIENQSNCEELMK